MRQKNARLVLYLWLGAYLLISCSPRTSPPGPNSAFGMMDEAGYVFHVWPQGLRVLILHDAPNALFCQGEGGTSSTVYHLACDAESIEGRRLRWEIETPDGLSATLMTAGHSYAIDRNVVLLLLSNGDLELLPRELSNVPFDDAQIQAFITADEVLVGFIQAISPP